jgi:NAD(P)H-hydrate epimerase
MIPVYGSDQVREHDHALIEDLGIPGRQLMEIAGKGCAEIIHSRWPRASVAVYCGPGNNGGDGYVIARWLHIWGHDLQLVAASAPKTPDALENYRLCQKLGLDIVPIAGPATVLVDALLGTGTDRAPSGVIATQVHEISERALSGVKIVAIDLPTGLCASTGMALDPNCVVHANLTLSLGYLKPGLLMAPGNGLVGEVQSVDIGLDLAHSIHPKLRAPCAHLIEASDVCSWLPHRAPGDAKWNQGHVAIRAGGGAAVLAAHGAFRAGVGLVTLVAPQREWADMHGLWPEVILAEEIETGRHDALVLGPGLGLDRSEEVLRLWRDFPGMVVADADALSILASLPSPPPSSGPRIITPHSAEAARLLGINRDQIEADRLSAAQALRSWGVAVLKGPHSLIASEEIWVNPTGSAALATAGSGDVLAGLVAGYCARGLDPARAAAVATWRHGNAGESLPENSTCSDLVEALR